ncbi:MAG: DUF6502 family protein [Pseudomonadota bacterium]
MSIDEPTSKPEIFARVLKGVLRPLVKALIAHGVTVPAVYRLLKELYVEVAETEFPLDDRRPTDSRIHLLTGVHRKDIRSIREAGYEDASASRLRMAAITNLVGRWLGDPETTDAQGAPLPLPRQSDSGPSFEALAASVSRDTRPRTLLDALIQQGLVRFDSATGMVRLDPEAVVGPAELGQKVHFFGQNVGDHIAAATDNLLAEAEKAPFLERAVFYNRLTPGSVDAIEASARALGTEALGTLNRIAFAHQQADEALPEASQRFRFGVFFFRVDEGPSDVADEGNAGADAGPAARPATDDAPDDATGAATGRTGGDDGRD